MDQVRLFIIALQFYTRVPVVGRLSDWAHYTPERLSESTRYFPLVGLLVGSVCSAVYWGAQLLWSQPIAVILSTSAGILLTGGFHEDGWADFCDGFGSFSSRARTLEIMTDSRIGTYAGLGLTLLILLKVSALSSMSSALCIAALLLMHTLSRTFAVLMMTTLPYAKPDDESKAKPIAQGLQRKNIVLALAFGACVSGSLVFYLVYCNYATALVVLTSFLLMFFGWWRLRQMMKARLGGYTGDTLGATQQVTEVLGYLGLAIGFI
jgi:adenosylcobinamide-GDP ribazoletransferase